MGLDDDGIPSPGAHGITSLQLTGFLSKEKCGGEEFWWRNPRRVVSLNSIEPILQHGELKLSRPLTSSLCTLMRVRVKSLWTVIH